MKKPTKCPYCASKVVCKDSSIIYGRSYGPVWICSNWPKCDAYVGCHPDTKTPLGRLANRELRAARSKAHAAFDPLWKSRVIRRSEAYRWLAEKLGIPLSECHIGMFDTGMCEKVVVVVEERQRCPK
jgi:Protein of unknown function (DUF3268).